MPNRLCESLRELIEKNSPLLFQQLASASLEEHFKARFVNVTNPSPIDVFIRRFTSSLYLDARNLGNPIVRTEYFETIQRGSQIFVLYTG